MYAKKKEGSVSEWEGRWTDKILQVAIQEFIISIFSKLIVQMC